MTTDAEVDEFLEHFGVRGQKWGVRTQQRQINKANKLSDRRDNLDAKSTKLSSRISKLDRKSENVHPGIAKAKAAGVVVGAALLIGGAIYAKKKLGSSGKLPISEIRGIRDNTPRGRAVENFRKKAIELRSNDLARSVNEPFKTISGHISGTPAGSVPTVSKQLLSVMTKNALGLGS